MPSWGALTDRRFAVPYAVAGWTAATVLGVTMALQEVGAGASARSGLWFRVGGGWIALLMAALAWILVSEPLRLERKVEQATEKLRRSEARYRALYDEAPLIYMTLDGQGRIQEANDRLEEVTDRSLDELQDRALDELFEAPEDEEAGPSVVDRFRKAGRLEGEELPLRTADGELRWMRLTMRWTEGDQPTILVMATDVTDLRRAEETIEHGSQEPRARVAGQETDDGWLVTVGDDGPGIPEEERDRIFDIFERGRQAGEKRGTGIGLAICRRIVDRHDGSIDVTEADLGGACFRIELPADPSGPETPATTALDAGPEPSMV